MRFGRINTILNWLAIILPLGAIGSAFFFADWPARRFLIFYVAPMVGVAPLWIRARVQTRSLVKPHQLRVDGIVFLAAFARFAVGPLLPFSGHMLFLTYSGLTTPQVWYRILALVLLIETTVFKLIVWGDLKSWLFGGILGTAAAILILVLNRNAVLTDGPFRGAP